MNEAFGPLLVLDSASLYYRSFFAMPSSMTAPDGRPNGAVRGFLSTLTRLVHEYRPRAVVAAWDADWRPEWRVDLVPSYKAHRVAEDGVAEAEPETLTAQAEAIRALLEAMGLPVWGVADYEADDVAGSVAAQRAAWPASVSECIVVSGDRDLVQLIDERVRLLLTVNGGLEKWPLLDQQQALERFGVRPSRYVDMAVLRGDSSDGLPGVAGVGPKTAVALIAAFESLNGVLGAAQRQPVVKPMTPRLAATIDASSGAVHRARIVTTVVRDLVLPGSIPAVEESKPQRSALRSVASEWGVERQVADLVDALGQDALGQREPE